MTYEEPQAAAIARLPLAEIVGPLIALEDHFNDKIDWLQPITYQALKTLSTSMGKIAHKYEVCERGARKCSCRGLGMMELEVHTVSAPPPPDPTTPSLQLFGESAPAARTLQSFHANFVSVKRGLDAIHAALTQAAPPSIAPALEVHIKALNDAVAAIHKLGSTLRIKEQVDQSQDSLPPFQVALKFSHLQPAAASDE